MALPSWVWAETIKINTAAALQELLPDLKGGETVLLAPGDYGRLVLSGTFPGIHPYPERVTFRSESADSKAIISGLLIQRSGNISFENLHFRYRFQTGDTPRGAMPFIVRDAADISFVGAVFQGDLAKSGHAVDIGYAVGTGLLVQRSSNIKVQGSQFYSWFAGAVFLHIDGLRFVDNNIHSNRSEGINCAAMHDALIARNHIHDFIAAPSATDHRDMIQCWSTNTKRAMDGLTIRGNILNSGRGLHTQSIFLRNELVDLGLKGQNYYYRNVLIEDNVIINAHLNGIMVGPSDGLTIRNNTVVRSKSSAGLRPIPSLYIPVIRLDPRSENVVVTRNIIGGLKGYQGQSSWQVEANAIVQDTKPRRQGYYGNVFKTLPRDMPAPSDFQLNPSGPLAGRKVGAPSLWPHFSTTR